MAQYPALIDGKKGAYGVTFPDLPGIVAMGKTVDEAMVNAEEALRDYAIEAVKDGEEIAPPSDLEEWKRRLDRLWSPFRSSVFRAGACSPT